MRRKILKKINSVERRAAKMKRRPPTASVPGTFVLPDDALTPKIQVYSVDGSTHHLTEVHSVSQVNAHFEKFKGMTHWVKIRGIGDSSLILDLGKYFNINRLVLADVVNVNQRPKMEEYSDHLFIVNRMMYRDANMHLSNDQVSIFLGKDFVISIQEKYDDFFSPIADRITAGKGSIRTSGPDHLAYAMLDAMLDYYFPLLEKTGEGLDHLEDELLTGIPRKRMMAEIQLAKRELITIRRTAGQTRDMLIDLQRSASVFVSDNTRLFLRDAYDHNIQVMDIVESYKETTSSLMDIYLSSANIRLNHIMKVLAVVSSMFIPPTFIVGVYGMNFERLNSETGEVLAMNMPELYSPIGYIAVMSLCGAIFLGFIFYFIYKGWLNKE